MYNPPVLPASSNPPVIAPDQIATATLLDYAQYQYQFIVASVSLAFTLLFFYAVFRSAVWFLPHFWHRNKDS